MQIELESLEDTSKIIGINEAGYESANDAFTANASLPWLQDDETDVWSMWDVSYRDVYILNSQGTLVDIYNLTDNDLAEDAYYSGLLSIIQSADE